MALAADLKPPLQPHEEILLRGFRPDSEAAARLRAQPLDRSRLPETKSLLILLEFLGCPFPGLSRKNKAAYPVVVLAAFSMCWRSGLLVHYDEGQNRNRILSIAKPADTASSKIRKLPLSSAISALNAPSRRAISASSRAISSLVARCSYTPSSRANRSSDVGGDTVMAKD